MCVRSLELREVSTGVCGLRRSVCGVFGAQGGVNLCHLSDLELALALCLLEPAHVDFVLHEREREGERGGRERGRGRGREMSENNPSHGKACMSLYLCLSLRYLSICLSNDASSYTQTHIHTHMMYIYG